MIFLQPGPKGEMGEKGKPGSDGNSGGPGSKVSFHGNTSNFNKTVKLPIKRQ